MKFLSDFLHKSFYFIAYNFISKYPKTSIAIPIIFSILCSIGFFNFHSQNSFPDLYFSTIGDHGWEEQLLHKYFPENQTSHFDPSRKSNFAGWLRIIVTTKNESNILNMKAWEELKVLDETVRSAKANWGGEILDFDSVCAKRNGRCRPNDILQLSYIINNDAEESLRIPYPIAFDLKTFTTIPVSNALAGIDRNDDGDVISAKAVILDYFLVNDDEESKRRSESWEAEALKVVWRQNDLELFDVITPYPAASRSFWEELDNVAIATFKLFHYAGFATGLFVFLSLYSRDRNKSKSLVGVTAAFGALLGAISGAGFLFLVGSEYTCLVSFELFIIVGIGVDDAFIVIASWSATDPRKSVSERLAETYCESSVAITITSLTNSVSFMVGLLHPLPVVRNFCLFASISILFVFFIQFFFLGGFLTISGVQEAKGMDGIFFWRKAAPHGKEVENSQCKVSNTEHSNYGFFGKFWYKWILHPASIVVVIIFYAVYLAVSIKYLMEVEGDISSDKLVLKDSYLLSYSRMEVKYVVPDHLFRAQVVFVLDEDVTKQKVDLSDPAFISEVQSYYDSIMQLNHTYAATSENWLQSFLTWSKTYKDFDPSIDITTKEGFVETLYYKYFGLNSTDGDSPLLASQDVCFNDDKTDILAFRFIIQGQHFKDKFEDVMNYQDKIENLSKGHKQLKNIKPFSYFFWNGMLQVKKQMLPFTLKGMIMSSLAVMLTTFTLIPEIKVSLVTFFTIVSVQIGVIGMITVCGIAIEPIVFVVLLAAIGFSVDFSTHVTYTFLRSAGDTRLKIRESLHRTGQAILQGAISTICALIPSLLSGGPLYETGFIMFAIILFISFVHSIIILPVLLFLVSEFRNIIPDSSKKSYIVNKLPVVQQEKKRFNSSNF